MIKKILIAITLVVFNTENVHSIIIDVRTQEEWDNGYIEDAIHIPLSIISENIDKFVKSYDEEILLYCRSGNRSGKAKEILEKLEAIGVAIEDSYNTAVDTSENSDSMYYIDSARNLVEELMVSVEGEKVTLNEVMNTSPALSKLL